MDAFGVTAFCKSLPFILFDLIYMYTVALKGRGVNISYLAIAT